LTIEKKQHGLFLKKKKKEEATRDLHGNPPFPSHIVGVF
jgi:hypothetical protein